MENESAITNIEEGTGPMTNATSIVLTAAADTAFCAWRDANPGRLPLSVYLHRAADRIDQDGQGGADFDRTQFTQLEAVLRACRTAPDRIRRDELYHAIRQSRSRRDRRVLTP
jgi:hypothetical protein